MKNSRAWIYDLLFVIVLLVAAFFRFTGINWDQGQHLHPDERFLTMVETSITPVKSLSEYFNTDTSTLNPHNVGHGFYVYGDLPIFIVRYAAEFMSSISQGAAQYVTDHGEGGIGQFFAFLSQKTNWAGYDEVVLLGRVLSGIADLGVIFLLYLIAARIYGRKVALLAAAFSSVAVMQIQQSHFFTVDNFANFFMFLTIYFAVEIGFAKPRLKAEAPEAEIAVPDAEQAPDVEQAPSETPAASSQPTSQQDQVFLSILRSALFWHVLGFGVALGMAMASKINAAPLVMLLPIALATRYFILRRNEATAQGEDKADGDEPALSTASQPKPLRFSIEFALALLILGLFISAVSFRVFQPYAFKGPGFLSISFSASDPNASWIDNLKNGLNPINPKWKANIDEQANEASGDPDSPPALQWARRSKLFSLQNIVAWGLGWPLGILACLGLLYMGWRILRGEGQHILLWVWTVFYLSWQSFQANPTMRYQLPIYPLLALMAAWLALLAFQRVRQPVGDGQVVVQGNAYPALISRVLSIVMPVVGILVLIVTAGWAYAFLHIYMVDHSRVQATRWIYQNVPGPFNLRIGQPGGEVYTQPMPYNSEVISSATPYETQFTARASGPLNGIVLGHAVDPSGSGEQTVTVTLSSEPGGLPEKILSTATLTANFAAKDDPRGESYTFAFSNPVTIEKDQNYFLRFTATNSLLLAGSAPINESSWDDGLPLRMDGYDGYAGIYQNDLNFEMYWDDNPDKLARFTDNLDRGDYIFISSNRQWGTTTRIPERYPLTISLYRNLLGCPSDKDVIWCYNVAKPGMFTGNLGYKLVQVFESFPTVGPFIINDQFGEEAFTVYDHPKVLIFQKQPDYNPEQPKAILGAVDLSNVIHLTPQKAASYRPLSLMLPEAQLEINRAGGTWSELFSYDWIQNNQIVGLLVWYLAIALLGWATYFFLRLLLPGLEDRGFPLARTAGLLLLAYFSWIVASLGGQYTRPTIAIGFGLILVAGLAAAWLKRDEIGDEIRTKGKYFLSVEGVFLAFFVFDLLIRLGNPDLWHPGKGGERPMDFAYLNAVLKSTTFPPYDPWFSGGYINYYYWGFVLVGTPIKLLGIVPSLAFNFVLPTLFALLALGGFSVAWNVVAATLPKKELDLPEAGETTAVTDESPGVEDLPHGTENVAAVEEPQPEVVAAEPPDPELRPDSGELVPAPAPVSEQPFLSNTGLRWLAGLCAGAGLVLIGNLGTVRMIYEGWQRMVVSTDMVNDPKASFFDRLGWTFQGMWKFLFEGHTFPFYGGDWYWTPSRAISTPAGSEITEFPLFTFLYSDLHAHMMALPLTVLAIAWALSVLLMAQNTLTGRQRLGPVSWIATLVFGGLVIGALRPTNTWDFPTYLALGMLVTGYAIFRSVPVGDTERFGLHPLLQRAFLAVAGVGLLAGLSVLFFQPFAYWYGLGYTSFRMWEEEKSPIYSYFIHWGLFFFVLITWLAWETRQWLAATPLSSLAKLKPYQALIVFAVLLVIGATLVLTLGMKVEIAWFALGMMFWSLTLILRPDMPDAKRFALFVVATGLAITLVVELIVLDGDIGRMNTIFKFYLQAWIMFAICSAAAIGWMVSEMHLWTNRWRTAWYIVGGALLAGALLFTFTATTEKITDRMAADVPVTLDSITYMTKASYSERDKDMDLSQDFRAIRWLQDNVKGSPVLLEGAPAGVQYTWFSRYSIYTGLPTVVGWEWHQVQQRVLMPEGSVINRGREAQQFYRTTDLNEARTFLEKYDVRYIVVGQLERAAFPEGLAKFEEQEGTLWRAVYRDGETVIYEVLLP